MAPKVAIVQGLTPKAGTGWSYVGTGLGMSAWHRGNVAVLTCYAKPDEGGDPRHLLFLGRSRPKQPAISDEESKAILRDFRAGSASEKTDPQQPEGVRRFELYGGPHGA